MLSGPNERTFIKAWGKTYTEDSHECGASQAIENKNAKLVEAGGVALHRSTETTQLIHFTLRSIRQKRPKRQSGVHGGYTESRRRHKATQLRRVSETENRIVRVEE